MAEQYLKNIGLTPAQLEDPPIFLPYWFEENDCNENRAWARKQLPACVAICFVYFLFVIFGPKFMKDRKPFDLQRPLILWNSFLALFSMAFVYRILPQLLHVLSKPNGYHISVCVRIPVDQPGSFWMFMYTLSKIAELGDTVFIVLRKKPLSFLHWFHHLTMVYLTFYMFSEAEPFSAVCAFMNGFVHSIMYTYYTLMAMKFKVPRTVAMTVTSIQLVQFISALLLNFYTFSIFSRGGDCERTVTSIRIYATVGMTYFLLFVRVFYYSYIAPKPKPKVG